MYVWNDSGREIVWKIHKAYGGGAITQPNIKPFAPQMGSIRYNFAFKLRLNCV